MTISMKDALLAAGIEEPVLTPLSNRAKRRKKLIARGISAGCVNDGFSPVNQEDIDFHLAHCAGCTPSLKRTVVTSDKVERRVWKVGRR